MVIALSFKERTVNTNYSFYTSKTKRIDRMKIYARLKQNRSFMVSQKLHSSANGRAEVFLYFGGVFRVKSYWATLVPRE